MESRFDPSCRRFGTKLPSEDFSIIIVFHRERRGRVTLDIQANCMQYFSNLILFCPVEEGETVETMIPVDAFVPETAPFKKLTS